MSDFSEHLRRYDCRRKQEVDQDLVVLKEYWEQWDPECRLQFKKWIQKLDELTDSMPAVFPHLTLKTEFTEPIGESDCQRLSLPTKTMRLAVEHWERGELYGPSTML